MPRPRISDIDKAIRRYAGAQRGNGANGGAPALPHTPPRAAQPAVPPRPAPAPLVFDGELDVEAIGRRAAHPPHGTTPDDLIERALHAAGVSGSWATSREYRELWYLCVLAREAHLEQSNPAH